MIDPTIFPHDVLLHVSRDEDVRYLVSSGLAWLSGPKTLARIIQWLIDRPDAVLPASTPDPIRVIVAAGRSA
jgi:hypothetical protein